MTQALEKLKALRKRVAQLTSQLSQMQAQQQNAANKAAQMEAENADDVAAGRPPRHSQAAIQKVKNSAPSSAQINSVQNDLEDAKKELAAMEADYEAEGEKENQPRALPPMIPPVNVPDASSGSSYEDVKAAMRQNLMAELSRLNNQIFKSHRGYGAGKYGQGKTYSVNPAQQKRLKELSQRLQNFDSYFDNIWKTEIQPQIKKPPVSSLPPGFNPNQPIPSYGGVPSGAAPQTNMPKPPVSSLPQPGSSAGTKPSTNQMDENGIPMVQKPTGFEKDRRFYKPDGSLFGTM